MQNDATPASPPIDLAALTPVERMALADALYDSAMAEIDAAPMSPEEAAALDRRIARVESGEDPLVPWADVYGRTAHGR